MRLVRFDDAVAAAAAAEVGGTADNDLVAVVAKDEGNTAGDCVDYVDVVAPEDDVELLPGGGYIVVVGCIVEVVVVIAVAVAAAAAPDPDSQVGRADFEKQVVHVMGKVRNAGRSCRRKVGKGGSSGWGDWVAAAAH